MHLCGCTHPSLTHSFTPTHNHALPPLLPTHTHSHNLQPVVMCLWMLATHPSHTPTLTRSLTPCSLLPCGDVPLDAHHQPLPPTHIRSYAHMCTNTAIHTQPHTRAHTLSLSLSHSTCSLACGHVPLDVDHSSTYDHGRGEPQGGRTFRRQCAQPGAPLLDRARGCMRGLVGPVAQGRHNMV